VIYIGSRMFMVNHANTGDITAFTIYMAQMLSSLIMITAVFNIFVRTKASTARIAEVFESEEDFAKGDEEKNLNGKVEFKNVTFAYPGGSGIPAIKDLSFLINSGESLAVIGPTGSGKSTIAWLLLRFYDVESGEILLDNNDIKNLGTSVIRNNITIVPQKPMLFSGSVAENLRWGDKDASMEEIVQTAGKAQADFIEQMDNGYNSILGSGGVNLSGGQKQRLSIARGMLKKAAILILDDATSALDSITEAKVMKNLKSDNHNQTVITITQRCGTAMSADYILVMENGRKVGFGTHEELMESCEIYQDIYHTQIESSREA